MTFERPDDIDAGALFREASAGFDPRAVLVRIDLLAAGRVFARGLVSFAIWEGPFLSAGAISLVGSPALDG